MRFLDAQEELDLTEGGVLKPLVYLSLPIVVSNLLQTAYNLADTFWLGRYSTEALAAISFAFPMVFLVLSLAIGVSVAGSVLVAQHVGADERGDAAYAASQVVTFALLVSALTGVVVYVAVHPVLMVFGASPAVAGGAAAYMRIVAIGAPFMFGYLVFRALMRGAGDTVTPMVITFGAVAINVVLDPFLIYGWDVGPLAIPELGIVGAAVATVFSRGLGTLVGIGLMASGRRGIRIRTPDLLPDPRTFGRILRIGLPASAESTGRAVSLNLLLLVVGLFPTPVVGAFGIVTRLFALISLPATAISRGVETMTGQCVGAGKPDRVRRTNDVAAAGLALVLFAAGVVVFLVPAPLVGLFTDDPAVVAEGVVFLRYVAPTFGFIGVMRSFAGGFRGTGQTMVAAAITVLALGVIRIPTAWVASRGLLPTDVWFLGGPAPAGIWVAFALSNVAGGLIAWRWFRRGGWRGADVRDAGGAEPAEPDAAEDA